MLTPRAAHTATLLVDGRVLVVGEDNLYEPNAELFDPATLAWTEAGSSASPRFRHTVTLFTDGRVLVVGGALTANGQPTDSVEIFDPSTDAWTSVAGLGTGRSRHSRVLLGDGRVMVAGGASTSADGPAGELCPTEIFDPASGTWTTGSPACDARLGHRAIVSEAGRVILLGAQNKTEALVTVTSYDPTTNRWAGATELEVGRVGAAASMLSDGGVLIVGGRSGPRNRSLR